MCAAPLYLCSAKYCISNHKFVQRLKMISLLSALSLRAIAVAIVTVLTSVFSPMVSSIAGSNTLPENPWHRITNFELDEDHGYMARSPFDNLSAFQLAAIPKGRRVHYNAPSKCVPGQLKSALSSVAAKYGPITVSSTFRSPAKNRKIGGKSKSWHLKCGAVDFRVHAKTNGLLTYLRANKNVGGYKRYKSGFYHIDAGPKRTW